MRSVIGGILSAVLAVGLLAGCGGTKSQTDPAPANQSGSQQQSAKVLKIGLTQIVEHPALDATRAGILEALKEAGFEDGKQIQVEFQSAQGEVPVAQQIAQKFVSDKKDLIIAIATPSSQAALQATKEIPVIFSAVTDPVSAGLVASLDKPGGNVTGVSDLVPVKDQLQLFPKLGAQYKRIGIIYNAGEANSTFLVEESKKAATELGLSVVEATVTNANEVQQAAQSLVGRVDALYLITDNTLAQGVQSVVAIANAQKLPTVASVREYVDQGALITTGLDYKLVGRQTGAMAAEILKGKKPAEIPVGFVKDLKAVVNAKTAEAIGLTLPAEIMDKAETVK